MKEIHMKKVLAGLTAVALLTTSLSAGHRGGDKRGHESFSSSTSTTLKVDHHHRHGGVFGLVSQLTDLTDDQITEIETIMSDERTAMDTLRDERRASATLSTFISESGLERDAFLTDQADFHSQMAIVKADALESLLVTLTPEQILELKTLIEAEADATTTSTTTEESDTTTAE
jgi:Spy/CpxP family protein refolding chaperone